jgi:Leucine-rich repeat (LRR) protein
MPLAPLAFLLATAGIDLSFSWVTDAELARLARQPAIHRIQLDHTKITDLGLEYLKPLRGVRHLSLYYAEYITDDGLAHLRDWKQLEVLNLRGTRVTSKVFEHLAHLTALRHLDLAFTQIDDDGFEHLASLPNLESLAIGGNRLTGSCLPLLKLLPSLRSLDVGGIQRVDSGLWGLPLSDQNLARLGELHQLRRLSLAGATLNDRGTDRPGHPDAERKLLRDLSPLASLTQLEFLDLTRQPVSPAALAPLARLPRLAELRLGMVPLNRSALPRLPSLRKLYLNGEWIELSPPREVPLQRRGARLPAQHRK